MIRGIKKRLVWEIVLFDVNFNTEGQKDNYLFSIIDQKNI